MAVGKYVNVKMWIGSLDDEPATETAPNIISMSDLEYFELTEQMFTDLPVLYMQVGGTGGMASVRLFKPNDTISLKMMPTTVGDGDGDAADVEPIISAEYTIQTISKGLSSVGNWTVLRIYCVFNAQTYLNQIIAYPEDNYLNKVAYQKTKATDVINDVLLGTSIGFACEKESNDASFWLSCNETRAKFIERLVQHSWVGPDDAPITYVDKQGILHYNTIRNMISMPIGLTCEFAGAVVENASESFEENDQDSIDNTNSVLITDLQHVNAAMPILNQGGYTLQYSLYDPYDGENMDFTEFPKWGLGAMGEALESLEGGEDPGDGFRSTEGHSEEKFLAGLPNKISNEYVSDNADAGMVFDDMHIHYNIAPKYNENIRRSFFQTFITFNVDVSKQGSFFGSADNMFRLGQVIYCNLPSKHAGPDALHSGKYIVCKIKHIFQIDMPYTIEVTAVTDGYYGA